MTTKRKKQPRAKAWVGWVILGNDGNPLSWFGGDEPCSFDVYRTQKLAREDLQPQRRPKESVVLVEVRRVRSR